VTKTKTKKKKSLHADGPIALRANCWFWYTVELVFLVRFLAQVSFSPSINSLFFLPKNCLECLSKNFFIVALLTHQSYYTSCFLFLFSDSFSHCSFTTSHVFLCRNFLVPSNFDLKSETSLFFERPVRLKMRWKYKSLVSDFDHVFSTIPNILVRFDRLVIIMNFENCSSLEYLVIRYDEHHAERAFKYTKTNYRNQ